ncbi:MAG: hypothetical protein R3A79_18485 [Nannocystaceae bacterium]
MLTAHRARETLRGLSFASLALLAACGDDSGDSATQGQGSETGTTGDDTTTTTAGATTTTTTTATTGDATTAATTTGGDTETTGDDTETTGADVLIPDPGPPRYAIVGEEVILDGSNSVGAVQYQWFFDDGEGGGWDAPMDTPIAKVSYAAVGRRKPILTVFDGEGNKLSASVTISVVEEPVWEARHASSVIAFGEGDDARFAAVSPDSDEVVIAAYEPGERRGFVVARRAAVSRGPRTLAHHEGWLFVAGQGEDRIDAVPVEEGPIHSLELPYGARPYGVVVTPTGTIFATLQGTGEVALLAFDPGEGLSLVGTMPAVDDARGLALLPDGRLAVSRWRSRVAGGEIAIVDPEQGDEPSFWLAHFDPQPPSDTEIGGVPSYLSALVVSPTAAEAALPSTQGNVLGGAYFSGEALHFDTTLRAVVSYFDLGEELEIGGTRKQFDGRGLASAAAYSYYGDYLFVATRGSQSVERVDRFTGAESSSLIEVGYAPQGLAVSRDGRFLAVDAYLARELAIYDLDDFGANTQAFARLDIPSEEPLPAPLLRGKQLFNDSLDPRLSKDGYIACAHCHLDGESDRQVWDFTDRGEGLRDTISLVGHAGTGDGPLHWSANFDEVQDFENDIRGPFAGAGLLDQEQWEQGSVSATLGDPKAGLSTELDALALYVGSLSDEPRSPLRGPGGVLTPEAEEGRALFESPLLGCATCHSGPRLTDSQWLDPQVPLLHDVGTIGAGSGKRLGGPLDGIDTPTLHGLWHSGPYLHDGSASTLRDVLTVRNPDDLHGVTSGLSEAELDALVTYLLSLDGSVD